MFYSKLFRSTFAVSQIVLKRNFLTYRVTFASNAPRTPFVQFDLKHHGFENRCCQSIAQEQVKNDIISVEELSSKSDLINALWRGVNNNTSEDLKRITSQLESEVPSFSVEELVALLNVLPKFSNSEIYKNLLTIIDVEGSKRVPFGEPGALLAGAMKMPQLQYANNSQWIWSSLKRFCRRPDRLTADQVVQLMYLVSLCRKIPVQYSGFDVQFHIVPHFDTFTLDQMAVISVGFFKSQTKMTNPVMNSKLIKKMHEEASTCNEFNLCTISKILRYSMPLSLSDELYHLQKRFVTEVDRFSPKALTHLALAGTNVLVCQYELILTIIDKFKKSIPELRLKDMERLLFVMSLFDIRNDDFINQVVSELKNREEELSQYPESFISIVNFLTVQDVFNYDLINRCLNPKFLDSAYRSFRKNGREIIYIDKYVEVERPEYSGNRLSLKKLKDAVRVSSFAMNSQMSGTQRFSWDIQKVLVDLYGADAIKFVPILPQFNFRDFPLGFDSNRSPVVAPDDWYAVRWGEVKKLPNNDATWLALIVGGWNTYIRNNDKPLGTMVAKMRQLKLLGFHPILVHYKEWKTTNDKEAYLRHLIDSELDKVEASRISNNTFTK